MVAFRRRIARLLLGLFLFALGIAVTLQAQIGYAPWDTFHVGVAKTTGLSVGTASIAVGLAVLLVTALLRERVGLGTIANMVVIGIFLDLILAAGILPAAESVGAGLAMLFLGLWVIALGSYFYIDSAFGAGPRDSLMVALARLTGLPIGVCRSALETFALLCGWRLGGMVGIGTALSAFLLGFFIQLTFRLLKFDATKVRHETLAESWKRLRRLPSD